MISKRIKQFLKKYISVKHEGMYKILSFKGIKIKIKKRDQFFEKHIKQLHDEVALLQTEVLNLNTKKENFSQTETIVKYYHDNKCWLNPKKDWWPKESFDFFRNQKNLYNKYLELIHGMDQESIDLITKIIARIQAFVNTGKVNFFLTEEEIAQRIVFERFLEEYVDLGNNIYARNGYIFPRKNMEISVITYKHGLEKIKHPGYFANKDIIDVGGFIGDSALIFSDLTSKRVHTFEPIKELFNKLLETIRLNSKTNIVPNCYALGAEDKIEIMNNNDVCSAIRNISNYTDSNIITSNVKVTTLDKYVTDNNLQVGLIKVDIEGYEQEFLKGALNTIKTQRPTLILSIYHNVDDFFNIKPMIESLNLGYKFRVYKGFDYNIFVDTVLICEVER